MSTSPNEVRSSSDVERASGRAGRSLDALRAWSCGGRAFPVDRGMVSISQCNQLLSSGHRSAATFRGVKILPGAWRVARKQGQLSLYLHKKRALSSLYSPVPAR
jgi:hypothetical protein